MTRAYILTAAALFIAIPSWAQTPPATGSAVPPPGPASPGAAAGRLQQTHGGWRSSKIVGTTVYNDSNQSIGSVDDLIVGQGGKVTDAVISVGGFLGIGRKLVSVPYDQLSFEQQTSSVPQVPTTPARTDTVAPVVPPTVTPMATANLSVTRIVLKGATKESLTSMQSFNDAS